MRALLDTNILIHRETAVIQRTDIGKFFNWLERLGYEKWIHPNSLAEVKKNPDKQARLAFEAKLPSYNVLKSIAAMSPDVMRFLNSDTTDNARIDSEILNELVVGHVDILITEDRGLASKGKRIGFGSKIFTIDRFLEKAVAENPDLVDYRNLVVQKVHCGDVNILDNFFDSFRDAYPGFDSWLAGKSQEPAYMCRVKGALHAFLYLKIEGDREPYPDIFPRFLPKRRLKIGTFKVALNGYKLGERFLKIVFDNAIVQKVDEIYVTIFRQSILHERLINLLEDFGFKFHGSKKNGYGDEEVFIREMAPRFDCANPALTFPYFSRNGRALIVPIYPEYHTSLFPDSMLHTESPEKFNENKPYMNAIRKVYVSRSIFRDIRRGDIIVFYRTGGFRRGVVTTIGIVDDIHFEIPDFTTFVDLCRQRSVFSDRELQQQWTHSRGRPFVVEFLYAYSLPKRPNLEALIKNEVVKSVESVPRGFELLARRQIEAIIDLGRVNSRIVVD